jgi:Resolvase, N terminal domain
MKTVALYLRVSSVDQHPETQLYDLRAMAQQRGFQIVAEYTDRISGTKARRPGLDELLRDARRGRFQVLLVWASDRIARSVRHFLEVLDELNHLNIEFVSFRENLDTGGPLGRAVVIIGAIAELERNLIIERCGQECVAHGWRGDFPGMIVAQCLFGQGISPPLARFLWSRLKFSKAAHCTTDRASAPFPVCLTKYHRWNQVADRNRQ